jgi:hypothetical protein
VCLYKKGTLMFKKIVRRIQQYLVVSVKKHRNPNFRTYYKSFTDYGITPYYVHVFYYPFEEDINEEIGQNGTAILKELFTIPQGRVIFISPDQVDIEKDNQAEWEDIQPKVLEILAKRKPK